MAAGDLVQPADAITWLGVPDLANLVPICISAVSASIQKWIGYQILQTSYTRTFNGRGGHRLLLPDRPVVSVSALSIDGVTVPASTGFGVSGFLSDDLGLYVVGCYEFCRGIQNVTATYSAGYATVPADLQAACLTWLSEVFVTAGENPAVSSMRAGDTEIDYAAATTEIGNLTLAVPPQIARLIMPYRRVSA